MREQNANTPIAPEEVENLLPEQNVDEAIVPKEASIINLADSHDEKNDSDIVIVGEVNIADASPKTQNIALRSENEKQKKRIKKLEIHVKALQKIFLENAEMRATEKQVAETNENPIDLSLSQFPINSEWIDQQVNQICADGNFTFVSSEIEKLLEEDASC